MARVEIVFEDNSAAAGGSGKGVSVICTPDAKSLFKKWKRKESLSPAESMALMCVSHAGRLAENGELADAIRGRQQIIEV